MYIITNETSYISTALRELSPRSNSLSAGEVVVAVSKVPSVRLLLKSVFFDGKKANCSFSTLKVKGRPLAVQPKKCVGIYNKLFPPKIQLLAKIKLMTLTGDQEIQY